MRTIQGIRLWTVKQAPFLEGRYSWNYSPGDVVFTPGMAKRIAPGPFATAPIVQGKIGDSSLDGDILRCNQGPNINGNFYSTTDSNQGHVSLWFTPEWSSVDYSSSSKIAYLLGNGTLDLTYQYDQTRFIFYVGGTYMTKGYSLVAGTPYKLDFRWDIKNTLDGINYGCISINDVHTFGVKTQPNEARPGYSIVIGNKATNEPTHPANGIIEGLTIYRRPLFDGTYGVDVGNGDEINLIYAAGAGKDPCLVTGSWDVCFCLPTNSTVGELVTGEGEAWSHPHNSNLLGAGGFMMDGTYTNDGWADEGTPTAVAALAAAEKIFNGGYKVTSDAANEGIYKDYTCSAGDDFVIRVLAHSDGTSVPKAILYDQTNTAEIGSLTGTNASTRAAPDVFIFTGEAPAGCTTLRVKLINTDATASDITYWHQCELLVNLINNPSLEAGAGDPWVPSGWANSLLDAGDTEAEAGVVHSGSGSIQFNAGAAETEGVRDGKAVALNNFCCVGSWIYGNGSNGVKLSLEGAQWNVQSVSSGTYSSENITAAWVHSTAVVRRIGVGSNTIFLKGQSNGPVYADDIYLVLLDNVSLTVTPASEVNCQEGGGIRVVGRSSCVSDITGLLGRLKGRVRFKWTPRHDSGDFVKFKEASYAALFQIYKDANNYINLYLPSSGSQIGFQANVAGAGLEEDAWSSSGVTADTTYLLEVEYNSIQATLSIDGVVIMTIAYTGGIDFGANIPDTVYAGSNASGANQGDAVFSAPF